MLAIMTLFQTTLPVQLPKSTDYLQAYWNVRVNLLLSWVDGTLAGGAGGATMTGSVGKTGSTVGIPHGGGGGIYVGGLTMGMIGLGGLTVGGLITEGGLIVSTQNDGVSISGGQIVGGQIFGG